MNQKRRPENSRSSSANKRKRKSRKLRTFLQIIFFSLLTFLLGLLLGILIGSYRKLAQEDIALPPVSKETAQAADRELSWNLELVNFENILTEDFEPEELKELANGDRIDGRVLEQAEKMLVDAKADGIRILCVSGYRSYERQQTLYENKVRRLQKKHGYSVAKAREEAAKEVAPPGTSEHQLGLALDLTDASYTGLDAKQETTAAHKWLKKHCHEYGFIVRYPDGKTEITGIIYEPWHFRYVGMEAAAEIMEAGITLEEYLENSYL